MASSTAKTKETSAITLHQEFKGHTKSVLGIIHLPGGQRIITCSHDSSLRVWNLKSGKQIGEDWTDGEGGVECITLSPDGKKVTVLLWNLDNGQPIGPPLQHAYRVDSVSFSEDGKLLATGCSDANAYTWDVDLLLNSKANQPVLHTSAKQPPVQRRPPAYWLPQGFFDGVAPNRSHSSAQSSSASPGSTLLSRLFHRNPSPSSGRATPLSSPLDRARNILKRRRQPSPAVVEVPCAPGQRRNACARERRKKLFPPKIPTATGSQPPKPNVTQSYSQPQAGSSTTPPVGDATGIATTSTTSRPDAMIRRAGLWTRFWLFLCCLSPEYTDGHH